MSDLVIFKSTDKVILINKCEIINIALDEKFCKIFLVNHYTKIKNFEIKRRIQPKEQVFFLRNIIKAINSGFVDFTDDKLYDFSFENNHAKDAGGVNNKFIDSDLKVEYKKEFDFYYQKMLNLINANNDLKFSEFMYKMSDFFAKVLSESEFNETPFELREKFFDYLTYNFIL